MPINNKIAVSLLLAVLWCSVVNFYADGIMASGSSSPYNKIAVAESCFSSDALNHKGFAIRTKNVVNLLIHFKAHTRKNHFFEYTAGSKASELLNVRQVTGYISFAGNLIASFQRTDIIFPSHYFW
jgi:hypothetical protein